MSDGTSGAPEPCAADAEDAKITTTSAAFPAVRWTGPSDEVSSDQGDFRLPVGTVTLLVAEAESATGGSEPQRFDDAVGRHGGVRPLGAEETTGPVAAFSRASDAVVCALELQRRGDRTGLRIGIHTGEVQLHAGGSFIGSAVRRAEHVTQVAHAGQIVMCGATHDLVADRLPEHASLLDLGVHRLRDLGRPERIRQLCHPDLDVDFPPLRSLDGVPNNLPIHLSEFVGRRRELIHGRQLLRTARLVTIATSGGCGKTRIALQLGADTLDDHRDGVWFCDLSPLGESDQVAPTIAATVGLGEEARRSFIDVLRHRLRDRDLLLILDNCEHVAAACADVADALLRSCPSVRLFVTSREPLRIDGEVVWNLPPMTMPATDVLQVFDALPASDATDLFLHRARLARPNLRITDDDLALIVDICRQLDGIPLAIELAAARVRVLTLEQIAAGLTDRFKLLGRGPRTAFPRQQTLLASVSWSHDLLTVPEKVLLRRLGVFVGGFDLDAAEAVCSGGALDRNEVLEVLARLVDRSLVEVDDAGPAMRYRLLETIRQFAVTRLADADEVDDLRDRHLELYAERSRHFDTESSENRAELLALLHVDHDNIRAAALWGATPERVDRALDLARAVLFNAALHGRFTEGRSLLDALLAHAPSENHPGRGWALIGAASLANYAGDFLRPFPLFHEALEVARAMGDLALDAACQATLGLTFGFVSNFDEAFPRLAVATELARRTDDDWVFCLALYCHGFVFLLDGNLPVARARLLESRDLAERCGFPRWWSTIQLGRVALLQADLDLAEQLLTEGAEAAGAAGDRYYLDLARALLAHLVLLRGRRDPADEAQALAAIEDAREAGSGQSELFWLGLLPGFALARADLAAGEAWAQQLLERATLLGATSAVYIAHVSLASVCRARGALERADEHVDAVLDGSPPPGKGVRMDALTLKAALAGDRGALDEADKILHDMLGVAGADVPFIVARVLECLALVRIADGRFESAVRIQAAVSAFQARVGCVATPTRVEEVQRGLQHARDHVGDDRFATLWREGSALSLDDATSYARRGRGPRQRPAAGWQSLTPAEAKVVDLIAEGLSNKDIAARLFVSPRTVASHLGHVYEKLGLSSRGELVAAAARRR